MAGQEEKLGDSFRDFTAGSVGGNVLALALPMVLEMGLQTTINVVDMFWVGKLGPEAVAGVSICGVFLMVVFSAVVGLSIASSIIVARRIGEKNYSGAGEVFSQVLYLGLIISVFFGIGGYAGAARWLEMLGASGGVIEQGVGYLKIVMGWIFTMVFLFVFNAVIRGAGEARTAMYILGTVNALNFILDPLLIFGLLGLPQMGVRGSATATVISQALGVTIQLAVILSGRCRMIVHRRRILPKRAMMGTLVYLGLPASFQLFVRTVSMLVIMKVIAYFGTMALAGYGIALRLFQMILMPGFGMGNAAATLVGQNLGAGKISRAERSAWYASGFNLLVMGSLSLMVFTFAAPIVRLFNIEPEVIAVGRQALRIVTPSYLATSIGLIMMRSVMGAGDTFAPMLINLITLWGFQIPAAYIAWWSGWGTVGVFWTIFSTNFLNSLLGTGWFVKGKWKSIRF